MGIPADLRQFRLTHVFAAVTSAAVALSIGPWLPWYGAVVPISVCTFWVGIAMFVISDSFDHGPIDNRGCASQVLNLLGILIVLVSVFLFVASLVMNAGIVIVTGGW